MKCEICHANDASALWQPFGPANTADSFLPTGRHDPGYPAISTCTPCRERFQQRQGSFPVDNRHFIYWACEGRVELLSHQQLDGRPVRKADLVGGHIIDVTAVVSLTGTAPSPSSRSS